MPATLTRGDRRRHHDVHSDAQIAEIAGSIRAFGFTNPVLIAEDGTLIAGHSRVLAARKLGMVTVPAIVLTGLSEAQRRALVLAENRIAMNAGWDEVCSHSSSPTCKRRALSAVAFAITGTRWNGHRFFGLRDKIRAASISEDVS